MIKKILPLTENKIKILIEIYKFYELNLSTISKNTNIAKQNVLRTIGELTDSIEIKKIGRTKLYSIKYEYLKILEPIIEKYRLEKSLKHNYKIIEMIKKEINYTEIYLFGSYAKEKETQKSDIDILIVTEASKKETKEIINRISNLINIEINAIIINNEKFLKMKNDSFSSLREIIFEDKSQRIKIY